MDKRIYLRCFLEGPWEEGLGLTTIGNFQWTSRLDYQFIISSHGSSRGHKKQNPFMSFLQFLPLLLIFATSIFYSLSRQVGFSLSFSFVNFFLYRNQDFQSIQAINTTSRNSPRICTILITLKRTSTQVLLTI